MNSHGTDIPAWSPGGPGEETPASDEAQYPEAQNHEAQYGETQYGETQHDARDESYQSPENTSLGSTPPADGDLQPAEGDLRPADQAASSQVPMTDDPIGGGTDYAGPVPPEPGLAEGSGVAEEDVIVIATQEAVGYGDPLASDDPQIPDEQQAAADPLAPAAGTDRLAVAGSTAVASSTDLGGTPAGPGNGAEQWSEIKALFVDDPSGSVKAACGLVEKAIEGLMASVRQRQDSLLASIWQAGDAAGTEELRNALRSYRGMFDVVDQISRQFPVGQDRAAGGI